MITDTVRSVVERFLKSDTPEVLAVKGAWGVGKTYAWNKLVLDNKDSIALPTYCYVSLFGLSSIADLRLAILAKTRNAKDLGKPVTMESVLADWKSHGGTFLRRALELGSKFRQIPIVKNASVGVEAIAPHLISKTIICLDDFERLGEGLYAEEVLGFVSSLKEEKGCKVVLIFNEQKLGGSVDTYNKYREKLMDYEVLYAPSPAQAADLVFSGNAPWHAQVRAKTIALGITNIRLLRKIFRLVTDVQTAVKDMHQMVLRQAIDTIVLIAWCYYEPDDGKPPISFIREFNSSMFDFEKYQAKKDGKEVDPKKKQWSEVLQAYPFSHMDEFDLAIVKAVDQGYIDGTDLVVQAIKLDKQFTAAEREQSFSQAWKLFHNSFGSNQKELVAAMRDSFKKAVDQIAPLNVNGTVKLLRELDEGALADELIEYYIEKRKDEPELFDMDSYAFSGEVTDVKLRERFAAVHRVGHPLPSLVDAALTMAKGQGFNNEDMAALEAATEEDFYKLFKADHGEQHGWIVKGCLRAGGVGGHQEVGARARAALERIAAESPLNAVRVNRYLKGA